MLQCNELDCGVAAAMHARALVRADIDAVRLQETGRDLCARGRRWMATELMLVRCAVHHFQGVGVLCCKTVHVIHLLCNRANAGMVPPQGQLQPWDGATYKHRAGNQREILADQPLREIVAVLVGRDAATAVAPEDEPGGPSHENGSTQEPVAPATAPLQERGPTGAPPAADTPLQEDGPSTPFLAVEDGNRAATALSLIHI